MKPLAHKLAPLLAALLAVTAATGCAPSGVDRELARMLAQQERLRDVLMDTLDAFRTEPQGDVQALNEDGTAFAVRNGAAFTLCGYTNTVANYARSDGGSRVELETRDDAIAGNGLPYGVRASSDAQGTVHYKAVPAFELASFGDCNFVVEASHFGAEQWVVFVIDPQD